MFLMFLQSSLEMSSPSLWFNHYTLVRNEWCGRYVLPLFSMHPGSIGALVLWSLG